MTKLICIAGARHVGKTTVLETLIPRIIDRGYTVAAVKYSTHAHELDTPGKNSWRLKKAGAEITAMVTPEEIAEYRPMKTPIKISDFLERYREYDVVLTEGISQDDYPTVEILREEVNLIPSDQIINRVATVSDSVQSTNTNLFGFDDLDSLAEYLITEFID
ncbi:MAG: molybdopterin-guanine dinucleotide biosynthesis protein B [Dehalococcoidia bacterium]